MTAAEVYELTTHGGATDFAHLIDLCRSFGEYCVIGDLAVNCYVEPVYTMDADIVLVSAMLPKVRDRLQAAGFKIEEHAYSVIALSPGSQLRIQFSTDERYQAFLRQAVEAEILGIRVRIACLEDVVQGKLGLIATRSDGLPSARKTSWI